MRGLRSLAPILLLAGCVLPAEVRDSALEAADQQLEAARRAGLPTELVHVDRDLPWRDALAGRPTRPEATYLVLTRTDAGIHLGDPPPLTAAAADETVRRWPRPFLEADDPEGAVKALVWGYLQQLRAAGVAQPSGQVVPFLEPISPRPVPVGTRHWGLPLALAVAAVVAWAAWRGPAT